MRGNYALLTAARNEEAFIERTIRSVLSQSLLPKRWVIVSDGSTDHTEEIVAAFAAENDVIRLLRLDGDGARNFVSKVHALRAGQRELANEEYEFIGILDADIVLEPHHYEELLRRFQANPRLGVAGGVLDDCHDGGVRPVRTGRHTVQGAQQTFRRQCYEEIGGLPVVRGGGEDTVAEILARMHGWGVEAFPDLRGLHLRPTGQSGGQPLWRVRFSQGRLEYMLGYHPLFAITKSLSRVSEAPFVVGTVLRLCGYGTAALGRTPRSIPDDVVRFLRREQVSRLRSAFTMRGLRSARHEGLNHEPLEHGGRRTRYSRGHMRAIARRVHQGGDMKRVIKLLGSVCFWCVGRLFRWLLAALGIQPRATCVTLCYHGVGAAQQSAFRRQMEDVLKLAQPVPAALAVPFKAARHHVAVTFDDGFQSVVDNALPVVAQMRIPVALFVPTAYLGRKPAWYAASDLDLRGESVLTEEQLRALPGDLVTIGSHSVTHPDLTSLDERGVRYELCESRKTLESILGRAVTLFAFPYGSFNDDLVHVCREAGYERVFTSLPALAARTPHEYVTGRVDVSPDDWPFEFRLKLLGAYSWLPTVFAVKRRLKEAFSKVIPAFPDNARRNRTSPARERLQRKNST